MAVVQMLDQTQIIEVPTDWKTELRESVTSASELLTSLQLDPALLSDAQQAALQFLSLIHI